MYIGVYIYKYMYMYMYMHMYIYIYVSLYTYTGIYTVEISQRFSQAVRPFSGLSTASSLPRKQQKPGAAELANPALKNP